MFKCLKTLKKDQQLLAGSTAGLDFTVFVPIKHLFKLTVRFASF